MIKKFENYQEDIDPYGEEDWEYEPEFQIGDIVTCINNADSKLLKIGEDYEIKMIFEVRDKMYFELKDIDDFFRSTRFIKKKNINENFHEDIDPYGEENWDESSTFKKGDRVLCIRGSNDNKKLVLGKEYVINYEYDDGLYVDLKLHGGWLKDRFKLIKPQNENWEEFYEFEDDSSEFNVGDKLVCTMNVKNGIGKYLFFYGSKYEILYKEFRNGSYKYSVKTEIGEIRVYDEESIKEFLRK